MPDQVDWLNAEKRAELVQQLREASVRAGSDHRRRDQDLLNQAAGHIDWAGRQITALRDEVRSRGGDPDKVYAVGSMD